MTMTVVIRMMKSNNKTVPPAMKRIYWLSVLPRRKKKNTVEMKNSAVARAKGMWKNEDRAHPSS